MGIFSFIKGKKGPAMVATLPVVDNLNADATDVVQQSNNEPKDEKSLKISYATGWPIEVSYG